MKLRRNFFNFHKSFSGFERKHETNQCREHYRDHLEEYFSLTGLTMALICLLQRDESRYHTAPLPVCVCAYSSPEWIHLCAQTHVCTVCVCVCLHLSWHANPSVTVWDVSSGVWLCGDLSCSNFQVWVLSLSVGLTPDRKDQSDWWQRQFCMTQALSKRMSLGGQPFHIHKSCRLHAKI